MKDDRRSKRRRSRPAEVIAFARGQRSTANGFAQDVWQRHTTEEGKHHDQQRDWFLTEKGFRVLRIPGCEVLRDAAGVRRSIESVIDQRVKELQSVADSSRGSS